MDAAIAGLVGSLGGVVLTSTGQALLGRRTHRWQSADTMNQERRKAYAHFLQQGTKIRRRYDWAYFSAAVAQSLGELTAPAETTEGLREAREDIDLQAQEIMLLTQDAKLKSSTSEFVTVMYEFAFPVLDEDSDGPQDKLKQYKDYDQRLATAHDEVVRAMRRELGINDL